MGAYLSCALSPETASRNSAVKVILGTGGDVRHIDGPVNAAELMLDKPDHFVVGLQSLQIGKRFLPLSADDELEMGGVYVLFPMSRVNSVVRPADMGGLFVTATSEMRKKHGTSGGAKILPEVGGGPSCGGDGSGEFTMPRLRLEDADHVAMDQFNRRLSVCRSRRPLLETISEESLC
ncbi:uncharacterized protein LOC116264731 [Nymphaea colorata]|nr:uncharacterized protein LOC116264731 [Nymphaea colorata]